MLRRVAPSALRTPISRVRSVTETSMMFMIPMPPTTRLTAAMLASRVVKTCVACCWVWQDVLLIADGEVVVAAGADVVLAPEHPLEVHHALLDRDAVLHLDRDGPEPVAAEDPVLRRLQRDEDLLVGVAEAAGRALRSLSTPMISNGMPRIRSVWWIMAAGLPPSISGTAEPSTAYRCRACVVAGGEHPAVGHGVVLDVGVVRGGADDAAGCCSGCRTSTCSDCCISGTTALSSVRVAAGGPRSRRC